MTPSNKTMAMTPVLGCLIAVARACDEQDIGNVFVTCLAY